MHMHAEHEEHEHAAEMRPSEELMSEHRVIERMLACMDCEADAIEAGKTPPVWVFLQTSEFIHGFADECHHGKEEWKMFPTLARDGMPTETGPMKQLIEDHRQGREFNRRIHSAAQRLEAGDMTAKREVLDAIRGYVKLLRVHIKKEDNMFFPMADKMLDEAGQQHELQEEFKQVERDVMGPGAHERFIGMLEHVEEELAV